MRYVKVIERNRRRREASNGDANKRHICVYMEDEHKSIWDDYENIVVCEAGNQNYIRWVIGLLRRCIHHTYSLDLYNFRIIESRDGTTWPDGTAKVYWNLCINVWAGWKGQAAYYAGMVIGEQRKNRHPQVWKSHYRKGSGGRSSETEARYLCAE